MLLCDKLCVLMRRRMRNLRESEHKQISSRLTGEMVAEGAFCRFYAMRPGGFDVGASCADSVIQAVTRTENFMRTRRWMVGILLMLMLPLWARAQNGAAAEDPLAKALQQSNVFVGKTLRGQVDQNALEQLTQNASAERPLKIAVVGQLPASGKQFATRNNYTKSLHDWLGMGRGTLIIRTKEGISAATDAVPAAQITQILQKHASELKGDLVNGIRQTVADLDAAAAGQANGVPVTPNSPVSPDNGTMGNDPPRGAQTCLDAMQRTAFRAFCG